MKKLTFLVYHKEYDAFLEQLRALGVVHIMEKQRGEADDALRQVMQQRQSYKNTLQEMYVLADKQPAGKADGKMSAEEVVNAYKAYQAHIQELQAQLPALEKDMAQMEPWGDFDWQRVKGLEKDGWYIRFYVCPEDEFCDTWKELYNAVVIATQNRQIYFVTVTSGLECLENIVLTPLRLPAKGWAELKKEREALEGRIAEKETELKTFCKDTYRTLEQGYNRLQGDIDLLKVKLNSEALAEGSVLLIEGWIPEDCEDGVKTFLNQSEAYYEIRDAQREDAAPIKLKNNAFVRMYEMLTKMYGMPDYAEFDPTPLIAPFFTLFFAFCMGDAGYGLALIALGFVLKRKMAKSMAGMMNLVITLGIASTVLGAVLGTFFGVALFDVNVPEWMKQFMVVGKIGDTGYDKQMLFALLIGVVHICVAMTVKAIGETVRYGFKNSLSAWGWLLLIVGFVCTGGLSFFQVISEEVSQWAFIVIGGVSAIGIYLLNNLRRNVLMNIGAGIWDTYNMATGLVGDILSYIRLYALGLAGGMLGGVFNQLAFMVNDAAGPALGWLFCGLILVLGHTLNIAMSCLSAFVHPLRLTFVEYFKNSGYNGKGETYKPFAAVEE